jgi:hypothetical protein
VAENLRCSLNRTTRSPPCDFVSKLSGGKRTDRSSARTGFGARGRAAPGLRRRFRAAPHPPEPLGPVFRTDNTLIYAFCGLQSNCAIEGSDNAQSRRTLRREALELSLYAFKYPHGVDQVVSLLQPVKDSGTSAVFLRKSNLAPELEHPLRDTLPLASPPVANAGNPKEAALIDALTVQNTFPAHFEPLPDGDAILVLDIAEQTPTQ